MSKTKKLTLSSIMVALGAAVMVVGAFLEILDLTTCCFASLLVMFVYIEIGAPYTWLVWICTSLAVFLIAPAKPVWGEYLLLFGIYPILKAYIERLRHLLWLPLKAAFFTVVIGSAYLICELVIGMPFFEVESTVIRIALIALIAVAAAAYDMFLTVLVRFYIFKIRPRIKKLLK